MRTRRGYVLLTVLLLLALAAIALASVCREAVERSLAASAADDELQRRWGVLSLRSSILPNAENILDDKGPAGLPVTRVRAEFKLTGTLFSVDVCDEQAKVNVNAVYARLGKDRAEAAVKQLTAGTGLAPKFRTTIRADARRKSADAQVDTQDVGDRYPAVFGSFSEIFPTAAAADLWPAVSSATNNITLYGNGRLNIRRASAAALTLVCRPTLTPQQVSQLLSGRSALPDNADLNQIFTTLHVRDADGPALSDRLSVTSAVHSMWVSARNRSGTDRQLIVRDATDSDDVRWFTFQW